MTSAAPPIDDGLWSPQRRVLSGGLVLTITLVAFEALAVSTVMPIVARELGGHGAVRLGLLRVLPRLADRDRGRRRARWTAAASAGRSPSGSGLFAIGLLIGGLAPIMPVLVAARFIQGLGAGTIPPIAYVAIGRSLPDRLRPRMFATLSTAWVLPGVIGPAIGGSSARPRLALRLPRPAAAHRRRRRADHRAIAAVRVARRRGRGR